MPIAVQAHEATRIEFDKKATTITNYLGDMFVQDDQPQAYLVEIGIPNIEVETHFHRTDEFQVVLSEGFRLGNEAVESVAVHYAESFKPYGPLVGDERMLSFFVLRAYSENGDFVMPDARSTLQTALATLGLSKRRGRIAASGLKEGGSEPVEVTGSVPILPPEDDGLAALTIRIMSGGTMEGPDPAAGGGQFYIVINGHWNHNGATLGPRSIVWVAADDPAPELQAGSTGLGAVIVQFPRWHPTGARGGSEPPPLSGHIARYVKLIA